MLKQKEYKIGDTEYVIQQFPATRGLEIGIHLIKIAMGAAEGVGNIEGEQDFLDSEYSPAKMVSGVIDRIDEKGTPAFIKQMIQESLIRPEPGDSFSDWYESKFSANLEGLYALMEAIIDHNNYLDVIKKKVSQIMLLSSSGNGKDQDSIHS